MSISDHDVEDAEEFSHGGDEGHEFRLPALNQSIVEAFDDGVMLFGHDDGHVEGITDLDASSPRGPFAAQRPAVTVGGSDSDEPGDLLAVELSEFRELRDERGDAGRSQSGNGGDDSGLRAGLFVSIDQSRQPFLQLSQLLFEELDCLFDQELHVGIVSGGESILFLDHEFDDLPFAGGQIPDFLLGIADWRSGAGVDEEGEPCDDACIDLVGFGELIGGSGEVSDLAGIDDGHGNLVLVKEVDQVSFESSGGFEADEIHVGFLESFEEE